MQVSASEQTHNSFPILRVIPELMGDHFDGRVVFISLFDVVEGDKQEIKAAYHENRGVFNERLRDYLDENYPAMSARMVDKMIEEMMESLIEGTPQNWRYDPDITSQKNENAIVLMPDPDLKKEDLVADICGLEASFFVDDEGRSTIAGIDQDWINAVIFHEVGHSPDSTNASDHLPFEVGSDDTAYKVLTLSFNNASGAAVDMHLGHEIAEQMHAARAIGSLMNANLDPDEMRHDTSAAVHVPGQEGHAPVAASLKFKEELIFLKKTLFEAIAHEVPDDSLSWGVFTDLVDGDFGEGVELKVSEEDQKLLEEIADELFDYEGDALLLEDQLSPEGVEKFHQLPGYIKVFYEAKFMDKVWAHGGKEAQASPDGTYAVLREQYLEGAFDEHPIAKQYAYEYLNAVQTLMPTKVPEGLDPKEPFEPPHFDEQGQHIALDHSGHDHSGQAFSPTGKVH